MPPEQLKDFKENKDGCVIGTKLASDRELKVGDPLPLKGDWYPGRHEPDGPRDLQRPVQDRSADVPVPLRLSSTRPSRGSTMGPGSGGSLTPASARMSGNAGHDLHQVQERRHDALAEQEDRRSLSQQRLSHPHANRGSLQQDVRRHAGRSQVRHLLGSAWPSWSPSFWLPATPWRWPCASGPPRWPCSRPSVFPRGWCCSWS